MRKLARSQDKAARLACKQLDRLWRKTTAKTKDPAKLSQLMQQTIPQLVVKYGDVASSAAMEWYRNISGHGYQPVMADPVDADKVGASVRWAMGAAYSDQEDGESTDSGLAGAQSRLGEVVDRNVRQAGRDTLVSNANRDRRAKGWAIVPSGTACAYCVMLASRGATYTSEDTAESSVHAHCSCEVVPDFGDGIDGYDPERYYDMYEAAAAQAGVDASPKDIAAEMRRMYPTQITDGVTASAYPIIDGEPWTGRIIEPSASELDNLSDFSHAREDDMYTEQEKKDALHTWTTQAYKQINDSLFNPEEKHAPWVAETVRRIDEAIGDQTVKSSFTVDRQMRPDTFGVKTESELLKINPGTVFDHAGYLATSLKHGGVKLEEDRILTRILVHKGDHAAWVEKISEHPDEEEMLLQRGRSLRLVDTDIVDGAVIAYLELLE